jgi:hypothetical protein
MREKPLQSVVAVMRASLRCISPRFIRRVSTLRFQTRAAAFSPPAIACQLMSRMRTFASVLSAMICAMPPPITPAPRTPACSTSCGLAAMRIFLRILHQEEEADEVLRDVAADQRNDLVDFALQAALDAARHPFLHHLDALSGAG